MPDALLPHNHYVTDNSRGFISVTGPDAHHFLQNIISNDLDKLEPRTSLHACLLSPQGKFLHDFYVTECDEGYLLDSEGDERASDLHRRLSLYKLRANVTITLAQHHPSYIWSDGTRHPAPPENGTETDRATWDIARIRRAIPDGSRDAEIGFSTLAELNLDKGPVSYTKGCYVGQELVARMHNRNLGKKHLVPAEFRGGNPPERGFDIESYGQMRSSCGNVGLILMNNDTERERRENQSDDSPIYLLGL